MAEQEILPPEKDLEDLAPNRTDDGRSASTIKLQTPGEIKTEMGKVYRSCLQRKITTSQMTARIYALRQMLAATEIELKHKLAFEREDDDTPTFTGLTLIGPPASGNGAANPAGKVNGGSSPRKETDE